MKEQIRLPFEPELPTVIPPEQACCLEQLRADAVKKLKRSRLKHDLTDRHLVVVSRYLDWLLGYPAGDAPCWPIDAMMLLRIRCTTGSLRGMTPCPRPTTCTCSPAPPRAASGCCSSSPTGHPTLRQKAQEKPRAPMAWRCCRGTLAVAAVQAPLGFAA